MEKISKKRAKKLLTKKKVDDKIDKLSERVGVAGSNLMNIDNYIDKTNVRVKKLFKRTVFRKKRTLCLMQVKHKESVNMQLNK